jgi:hypothetical protein
VLIGANKENAHEKKEVFWADGGGDPALELCKRPFRT